MKGLPPSFQPRIPTRRRQPLKKLCGPNNRGSQKHLQRGVGCLRSDPDALALNLAEFMWKKRHRITTSAEDCKKFYCQEFPRLMK